MAVSFSSMRKNTIDWGDFIFVSTWGLIYHWIFHFDRSDCPTVRSVFFLTVNAPWWGDHD
jgi:hypothetical protein